MAAILWEKRLSSHPESIRRYEGSIEDGQGQTTNRQWTFRFWREDCTANRLPLRIEFQPKTILRLSLARKSHSPTNQRPLANA